MDVPDAAYRVGRARDIYFCADAHKTLDKIMTKAGKDRKLAQMLAKVDELFGRFAETGTLSNREHFNHEGDGFWAFKAYQLRAYGWYPSGLPRAFVISHFVVKKQDKLAAADKERMQRNRGEYGGGR